MRKKEKKNNNGTNDQWEKDGVVHCKAHPQIPPSLECKPLGNETLQFLPPEGEVFLHPSRNSLDLEVSAAKYHCHHRVFLVC